jgi:hypothetical protein
MERRMLDSKCVRLRLWIAGVAALVSAALLQVRALEAPQSFPPALERYFSETVHPTSLERSTLLEGSAVTKLLDADPSKEVAVFGAVWISAPTAHYIERLKDIENFERGGGFHLTRRISSPPRLEDFDALELPSEDVEDLRSCRVGDCELKLSAEALERMRRTIDWSKPTARQDVESLMRQLALDYVTRYLEGGNQELAIYRDRERPTFVANEFRSMVETMPRLTAFAPELRAYLLDFPGTPLPAGSSSFLYWQEAQFGLKPVIRINHLVIHQDADAIVVANKQLYATHYFWTALELRVLLTDSSRGPGFWFMTLSRSRSDGLSGFIGRVIRGRVRNEARKGIESSLWATKNTLEGR